MSFRELRNCAEMLRALGFPRLISMENFRTPNFELTAEILSWVVQRFEPGMRIPTDIDTEQDRVIFIRSAAEFLANQTNVRLNTKKLYQADGLAVQELLKVLSLLYGSLQTNIKKDSNTEDESSNTVLNFDVTNKMNDMKQLRSLASLITTKGATLYDLLRREVDLRENRNNIINRQLELTDVESGLQNAIQSVETETKQYQTSIDNVASDEANLDVKIDKKKTALERSQKRLHTLNKVRPAFMDEYEKLEEDLTEKYKEFSSCFLNLSFLEATLEEQEKADQEKRLEKETTRKGLSKLHGGASDVSSAFVDEDSDDDDDSDDSDEDDDDLILAEDKQQQQQMLRPIISTKIPNSGEKTFGNMGTGNDLDSESLDSDLDFNENGHDSDIDGLQSDVIGAAELSQMNKIPRPVSKGKRDRRAQQEEDFQDDDF